MTWNEISSAPEPRIANPSWTPAWSWTTFSIEATGNASICSWLMLARLFETSVSTTGRSARTTTSSISAVCSTSVASTVVVWPMLTSTPSTTWVANPRNENRSV